MTFEIPESKSIDIEALKVQMNGFFNLLLSTPSIVKKDAETGKAWEASPEFLLKLEEARRDVQSGNCRTLSSADDINAFFDSL